MRTTNERTTNERTNERTGASKWTTPDRAVGGRRPPRWRSPALRPAAVLAAVLVAASTARGQDQLEPDPAAAKAFADLVASYRQRPALDVETTLRIELRQGDVVGESSELKSSVSWSRGPGDDRFGAGRVTIRGYECTFGDGTFSAVHGEVEHSYYRETYEDSPYWVLFAAFQDLPYPHLAILWGEADPREVWMQLHLQTPLIVPTAVETVPAADGRPARRRLVLSSPNARLEMMIDPKTSLIDTMTHEITGGPFVQPGATRVTHYACKATVYDAPRPAEALAFDPGDRQRVDLLAAMRPPPPPPAPGGPGGPEPAADALVGKPAPPFVLATSREDAIDLEELRGKVVVVDFWATWCGPCVRALPQLHEVASWARGEGLPVEVLTVNVFERGPDGDGPDARRAAVRAFWKQHGFTLPVAMDYTDAVAASYGVRGIPMTVIIRSDGIVHAAHTGASPDYADVLRADIRGAIEALEAPPTDE